MSFLQETVALSASRAGRQEFHSKPLYYFSVHAFGQIHSAHPAASDYVHQPVGPAAPTPGFELRKAATRRNANREELSLRYTMSMR